MLVLGGFCSLYEGLGVIGLVFVVWFVGGWCCLVGLLFLWVWFCVDFGFG